MKLPLRSLVVPAAALLCFGRCSDVFGEQSPQLHPSTVHVAAPSSDAPKPAGETTVIPGPLRSFLRMAGISQQIPPDEVLPMLSRNVTLWGHENGKETEFLVLLSRYVQ